VDLSDKLAAAWERVDILTAKNVFYAGLAIGGAYVVIKTYGKLAEGAETLGGAIGSSLAELQMWWNGSHPVEFTRVGFVLSDKYISASGYINPTWRSAIAQAHDGNVQLLAAISTPEGYLKTEYMHMIGQEITPEVIQ
jgi:hypothetical protein